MKIIDLKNISVKYNDNTVFDDFSCSFDEGKFYTLLGPSGCGKTTLLRIIAGFNKPNAGEVILDGKKVNDVEPNKRNVNTVFQDYALFEHLNVFENVAFALKLKKIDKKTIEKEVKFALEQVNLSSYINREISELSGGQKQRVAIARALVNKPKVLLLDEPLSALDLKLRTEMQYVLRNLQQKLKITFIFVTHDQEEALAMSDYIFVLNNGIIEHEGMPTDIYDEPNNRFVADFIGESNILTATYVSDLVVNFAGQDFACVDRGFDDGEIVDIVIRPEDLQIVELAQAMIKVSVATVLFRGIHYEVSGVDDFGNEWLIHTTKNVTQEKMLGLAFNEEDIHVMKAR